MLATFLLMPCVGCATTAATSDRTEGRRAEFYWQSATRDAAVFATVSTDGVLRTAGGADALIRSPKQAFVLTTEELSRFFALLDAASASVGEATTDGASDVKRARWDIMRRSSGPSDTTRGEGSSREVDQLLQFVRSIMLRAYQSTIDAQPEAGPRR